LGHNQPISSITQCGTYLGEIVSFSKTYKAPSVGNVVAAPTKHIAMVNNAQIPRRHKKQINFFSSNPITTENF
jgi:hypothetical protein